MLLESLGQNSQYGDLIATSNDLLRIWRVNEGENKNKVTLESEFLPVLKALIKNNEFNAPLTSFDWHQKRQNLVSTSSIDTTCCLWDIEKKAIISQVIAHDKEVYDISFSGPNEENFGSVSADGSARLFDLRELRQSTVLYETENCQTPLLKLAWNKLDPNYFSVVGMNQNYALVLDRRKPLKEICRLNNHKESVNALSWAPQSQFPFLVMKEPYLHCC